jgi:hypothetical protein
MFQVIVFDQPLLSPKNVKGIKKEGRGKNPFT